MTDEVVYAYYPVFAVADRAPSMSWDAADWEVPFKELADRVEVRGVYGCEGFRPDADLMMWWVARDPDAIHELSQRLRRTSLGRRLRMTHAFTGAVRPAEFNPSHLPAFLRGEAPRKYLCVYPFVRTAEWYLLPSEERAGLLREHGEMGREYPDVLPNTTSAFGLTDWEWILAFEADELHRIVDCIRRLRDSASRRYVKEEVPFVVGIRKSPAEAIGDLA
jgi:hydrogen peroxide-dependent heme synthase